ncbi:class I SAM-dependent methyltransferase [Leptospira borgpetersenii]|uniref:class I SAM-dependent methyltransferase n=1 Tax=Leptospira borgpetersenii TaxID=174 RepID=UPI0021592DEA|nr:class I SAM-dependent methyltransferase [Leptospira borgpetersenii]UVD74230.1 class I SAM-dependent methyltransferase [Leptospira borgpetersenii]UVD77426.1 class I SAM-dependent methyltransferase [Leptospira borgpetersenii]UZW33991.1 class I SAM-dependent methyltransferase [Leptospira borgpetersenii]
MSNLDELPFQSKLADLYNSSKLTTEDKLSNFPRFVNRRDVAKFLNRYEIFKKILNVHGSIVECGVNLGAGFFSWLHFSTIFEPYNHNRRIIGFDTFEGFQNVAEEDRSGNYFETENWKDFAGKQSHEEILNSCRIHNENRTLSMIPKMELIAGDATITIPNYVNVNKHLIVALLHIDFDIYTPTKIALESFKSRMPKGGVIVFDEINDAKAPGEAIALFDSIGVKNYFLHRNSFDSNVSYIVL